MSKSDLVKIIPHSLPVIHNMFWEKNKISKAYLQKFCVSHSQSLKVELYFCLYLANLPVMGFTGDLW